MRVVLVLVLLCATVIVSLASCTSILGIEEIGAPPVEAGSVEGGAPDASNDGAD